VHAKRVVVTPTNAPRSVAALAVSLPASSWYQRTVSEGTKGPIVYEFARQRITLCKDGLPERTVWLVLKRTLGMEPTSTYLHQQCPGEHALADLCVVKWAALGGGTMFRGK
jgi:hypothetical protein